MILGVLQQNEAGWTATIRVGGRIVARIRGSRAYVLRALSAVGVGVAPLSAIGLLKVGNGELSLAAEDIADRGA